MVKNKPKSQVSRDNMMSDGLYEPLRGQNQRRGTGRGRGGSDHQVQDYKYGAPPQRGSGAYGGPPQRGGNSMNEYGGYRRGGGHEGYPGNQRQPQVPAYNYGEDDDSDDDSEDMSSNEEEENFYSAHPQANRGRGGRGYQQGNLGGG